MNRPYLHALSRIILVISVILTAISCEKDEKEFYPELVFPLDTYYVSQGTDLRVYIQQGNGAYELNAADANILAFDKDEQSWPAGAITISGLKKGSTTLTVNDIRNKKNVTLNIHVVDPYLITQIGSPTPLFKWKEGVIQNQDKANEIRNDINKYKVFEPQNILVFKTGTSSEYMLFQDTEHIDRSQVISEGSFEFSATLATEPMLILTDKHTKKQEKLPLYFYQQNTPKLLLNFLNLANRANSELTAASGEGVQLNTSPVESLEGKFFYFKDISAQIKAKHPEAEIAQVYQDVKIMEHFHDYGIEIGSGILAP
ncbi:hypothetical protein [Sphingobacterium sp. JB170]|uniref:hypothetical protein n=1 Tax=Sphingobacterium sp. JB170 TaxID=1434842 RepID=UPI00097E85F6|nr:hypothetical protein [Sphingobacterium sp. JB170]SJN19041.1 hypothetical protein FM107_01605 [Sphingobacterium sp. JB170]